MENREAHAYFFADKLDRAEKIYESVKRNLKANPDQLQIAAYQLVLTMERNWRKSFNQATEKDEEPSENILSVTRMKSYEKATLDFANRYPTQNRSTDLLLSLAGAYRDQGLTSKANELWQRVLISVRESPKRTLAIRGVVHSFIENNEFDEAIASVKRFLSLEDWKTLGGSLKRNSFSFYLLLWIMHQC